MSIHDLARTDFSGRLTHHNKTISSQIGESWYLLRDSSFLRGRGVISRHVNCKTLLILSQICCVTLTGGCADLGVQPGASRALKTRLEKARLERKKDNNIINLNDPDVLVKTLRGRGERWLSSHPGLAWNLDWRVVLSGDGLPQLSIDDKVSLVTDQLGQWQLEHLSKWRTDAGESTKSGKRCGFLNGSYFLGSLTGPWSALGSDRSSATACVDSLGEPFAAILSVFQSKILLAGRPGQKYGTWETVELSIRGPERPETATVALPKTFSEGAEQLGSRLHLLGQYAAVQSLEGRLVLDRLTEAPLTGALSLDAKVMKGGQIGRLTNSIALNSTPSSQILKLTDPVRAVTSRRRLFKQREVLLGIPPRAKKGSEPVLPKSGDGPRFIARDRVEGQPDAATGGSADDIFHELIPQLEDKPE